MNYRHWIKNHFNLANVEVVAEITAREGEHENKVLEHDSLWDYILVFCDKDSKNFIPVADKYKISDERIIYPLNHKSWLKNLSLYYSLMSENSLANNRICRWVRMELECKRKKYITCHTDDDLIYMATSQDRAVMTYMYMNGKNHAYRELELFYALCDEHYHDKNIGSDSIQKYFVDIGANIGTSGIYFKKKLDKSIKLLTFEPDSENFKCLRINYLLNDIYDDCIFVKKGCGNKNEKRILCKIPDNPGGNSVMYGDGTGEMIDIVPLDEYLPVLNINFNEIKYLWIDTEGFEPYVLFGAKKLLSTHKIPIFMEFNPHCYETVSGLYKNLMDFLCEHYSKYIFIPEALQGTPKTYSIETLWQYENAHRQIGDIFLLK